MLFGAHVSSAGGVQNAPGRAAEIGCEVFQMFSRPPQGGKPKPITDELAEAFQAAMSEHNMQAAYIHAPYFINLASATPRIYHASISILRDELERGSALGCRAMMFHPGSAKDVGSEKGAEMVVEALNKILDGYEGSCQLLVEIAAGAGEIMGDTFEEIARFINLPERGKEIGVCFDTQHAFASGYDLRTKEDVYSTFRAFDEIVGIDRLTLIHGNDSKVALEAKKDRHEHLGDGEIGKDAFQFIVQHPDLQGVDLVLETPIDEKRLPEIELLKSFRGNR